jgi:hypothetical protein
MESAKGCEQNTTQSQLFDGRRRKARFGENVFSDR